jgi:hypothetical protein
MSYIYGAPCKARTFNVVYRGSHELRSLLREGVPYVKLYRYDPKHLYQKLNGYGDNGYRKVWASVGSTYCTPSVTPYSSTAHARQRDITVHCSQRKVALTSQDKGTAAAYVKYLET